MGAKCTIVYRRAPSSPFLLQIRMVYFQIYGVAPFLVLLRHFTLSLSYPLQGGRQYNFMRYIGVCMMLGWDFCFFILLVGEADQTHIDGWVKSSRILLNNLQP